MNKSPTELNSARRNDIARRLTSHVSSPCRIVDFVLFRSNKEKNTITITRNKTIGLSSLLNILSIVLDAQGRRTMKYLLSILRRTPRYSLQYSRWSSSTVNNYNRLATTCDPQSDSYKVLRETSEASHLYHHKMNFSRATTRR